MKTIRMFPNVRLGEGSVVQDWVVIGLPPPGSDPGELETVIESGAVIRSHSVIYAGSRIGSNFQTGHRAIIGPGSEIGNQCSIGTNSVLKGFAYLEDGAKIHSRCSIGPFSIVRAKAWIGPRCTLESNRENPIVIASGAILGTTISVKSGVRVGERSLVAAGTRIEQDIPPYHLVAGNPARSLKDISRLSCPYKLIDRPYEPDPEPRQEAVRAWHLARPESECPQNTWRHQLWFRLGCPEAFF